MYSKFENLDEDKKKRILDACVEEFSRNGYTNASTNNIVRNAGISKGILFHYFGNKKSLYLYTLDYTVGFLTELLYQRMTDLPLEYFERITKIGMLKVKMACEYPVEYKFVVDAVAHPAEEVKEEVRNRLERMYTENLPLLHANVDLSRFKKGIDTKKAMELIEATLEGLSGNYMKRFRDMPVDVILSQMEQMAQEINAYIRMLKSGVYESEE